jgi:O-antigen ligase
MIVNTLVKAILMFLLAFTPIAFGSVELWGFSILELGILSVITLGALQALLTRSSGLSSSTSVLQSPPLNRRLMFREVAIPGALLILFFLLILFQIVPLSSGTLKMISPRTYELRQQLLLAQESLQRAPLSFYPFATEIEFLKWLLLAGFFFFLLRWKRFEEDGSWIVPFVITIILVGVAESLYGMLEFFTGHRHLLYLVGPRLVTTVQGTFTNHNYFAGFLLMVIPLSIGFLFSRRCSHRTEAEGWRQWFLAWDGKSLLIAYAVIIMILGLFFSGSRMGILSLLFSLNVLGLFLRNHEKKERYSKISALILGLAILWAIGIGLDAVASRFFSISESISSRTTLWMDTLRIVRDFPLWGTGLGTFTQVFPSYRSFHLEGLVTHAENDLLQLFSEVGLLGGGLMLTLLFFLFLKGCQRVRSLSSRDPQRYIGMGSMVGILALLLHSLVERNIQIPANAFLFTFLLAMVHRLGRRSPM